MNHVRELEVWSRPGRVLHPEYGKRLRLNLNIPDNIFLGVSAIPDELDVTNLKSMIAAGDVSIDSFNDFCAQRGLSGDVHDIRVAADFIEYSIGRCVAWIHLPEGAPKEWLEAIVLAVAAHDLIVLDPVSGEIYDQNSF